MLKIISLIFSAAAFFAAIWIIIPAPAYFIWLFSVAASEWSLWIGGFSLIAIVFCFCVPLSGSDGKLWIFAAALAFAALIISLYPLFSVLNLAKKQHISLSISRYLDGLNAEKPSDKDFSTHTFASVDGEKLQFDFHAPQVKNENDGASVIVIHGGSWNAGNRNDFPNWNKWLAENGYAVFDIDYRISPQPNYLTATADVKCAVLFIKENAEKFNISPERIALFGRSAGAHLALLAAYSADNSKLPPSCPANGQDEKVRAVVSFYAPIKLLWAYDNPANEFVINGPEILAAFLGGNPHESAEIRERFILASPTTHISSDTPPTLLVHGGKDQLVRSENMDFADEKLSNAKIPHKTIFIPYAQHGFDYNFYGWGSQMIKPAMLAFLRENTKKR